MTPFVMSKATWEKLSDTQQRAAMEAAREATALQRKLAKDADDSLLAGLRDKGMQVDKVDRAACATATTAATDKWIGSDIGPFVKKVMAAAK